MKKINLFYVSVFCLLTVLFARPVSAFAENEPTVPGNHTAAWIEIPVSDMNRGLAFYNAVLGANMVVHNFPEVQMAFFPGEDGALIKMEHAVPGPTGPIVYLNGKDNLQPMLDRVVPAGGKVIVQKTLISPEIGYFAIFLDTEGNRLGMYSRH